VSHVTTRHNGRYLRAACLLAGVILQPCTVGDAQVGYLWTATELHAKAQVVAVVEVAAVGETGRRTAHPTLQPRLPVIELETRLRVLTLFKAPVSMESSALQTLTLVFLRLDIGQCRHEQQSPLGAPPPSLMNAGSQLHLETGAGHQYLVYLSRRADGRCEPLSGHTFPTDSVFRLCETHQRPC
jgi:hypothetical protein